MAGNLWPKTKLSDVLKIKLPLIQAPMANVGGAELVAAVSNAGGLGSLGAGYMHAIDIKTAIEKIRSLTDKPFAINLFIPGKYAASPAEIKQAQQVLAEVCPELNFSTQVETPYVPAFEEQVEVILAEKIPILSFTFGIPGQHLLQDLKKNATLLIGTATTLLEAQMLEEKGIDVVVAQASEAGGHRGTFLGKEEDALIGLASLLPQIVERTDIPVVAAGGIMDAKGVVAALNLGAAGVQMGTAFLTCDEAHLHQKYKEALLQTTRDNTKLTRAFTGKLARGINNTFITRMQNHEKIILDYPIQHALTRAMRKQAAEQNEINFMSLWAGQAAYLCKETSAKKLINELNNNVIHLLKNG